MARPTAAEIKKMIRYQSKGPSCVDCIHFAFESLAIKGHYYTEDRKLRCALHDFATKRLAWCPKHRAKK